MKKNGREQQRTSLGAADNVVALRDLGVNTGLNGIQVGDAEICALAHVFTNHPTLNKRLLHSIVYIKVLQQQLITSVVLTVNRSLQLEK